jgi:hypothetical protein
LGGSGSWELHCQQRSRANEGMNQRAQSKVMFCVFCENTSTVLKTGYDLSNYHFGMGCLLKLASRCLISSHMNKLNHDGSWGM